MLYLVRHAKAGSRSEWTTDDRLRPLSGKGRTQAEQIADRLVSFAVGELVSSPYLRCIETLQPLAARVDGAVRADERLAEDTGFEGALDLLLQVPDGSLLCSHGDVIPAPIGALQRRGCRILTEPDWRKASIWVLTRTPEAITEAIAWPPPDEPART
jgi:phosphohistidine phosphatase SixA